MTLATEVIESDDISIEELEALMADEFEDEVIEKKEDEILEVAIESADAVEVDESLLSKAMRVIGAKEATKAAYESQPDEVTDGVAPTKLSGKSAKAKVAKVHSEKEKVDRKTRFTHSREELVKDRANPNFYLLEKADLDLGDDQRAAKEKETLDMINAMNVKIGSKCLNLLSALNGKSQMSTFVKSGFKFILGGEKITNANMVEFFMSSAKNGVKSYSKGTAMPQSTNLLRLFFDMKVIVKDGAQYVVNENSTIIEAMRAMTGGK
jgi:hypothetical protein